jgi:carbon monoxide dehydrogenase subunit G
MAIEIRETFTVLAPIDQVWPFVMDPHKVVTCMPGAKLDQVVDERTFLGSVHVKVGAISTSYKGRVQFTEVDAQGHVVQVAAEGRETGGGVAKGTMSSRLRSLPDGYTEVVAEASVDLTGRIIQVGRGMIQGVARQLFQQFAVSMKQQLEGPSGGAAPAAATGTAAASQPIRILPLVIRAVWSAIVDFFRRVFGRSG